MTLESKHILCRTFLAGANIQASVTDSGGTRTVTAVNSDTYYRYLLAEVLWTGALKSQPVELTLAVSTALNAALGSALWKVYHHTSGRVAIQWTGTGNASVSGDAIRALGFSGAIGPIAPGTTVYSDSSAQGALIWNWYSNSSGFYSEKTAAFSQDELGRTYAFLGATRWVSKGVAQWLPREFADNAAGEYLSPVVSELQHLTGAATPTSQSPSAYKLTSWVDTLHTISGREPFGYYEKAHTLTSTHSLSGVVCSEVHLGSESLAEGVFRVNSVEPNLITRYEFNLTLNRTGRIVL
jgi:hypothetical protein